MILDKSTIAKERIKFIELENLFLGSECAQNEKTFLTKFGGLGLGVPNAEEHF